MGCGSCGTATANGKPAGCQSNGNCGTSGCNRINVFNWLADIPLSDLGKPYPIVEVAFNNGSRKDFYKNNTTHQYDKGALVAVEGVNGFDVGQVTLTGELVKLQMKKYGASESDDMKRILHTADERELELYEQSKSREKETMIRSRAIARQLKLEMKIAEAEIQADGKKITFFYTADSRVDFRELIKVYSSEFKARIEMRQIGARQEAAKIGGIGSCGRELCCSSWLTEFKTVNTTAARYQNLSINQAKLSGQCGRLKCCLNYELDTYMDALRGFPDNIDAIEVAAGRAFLQKKDIFKNLMWFSFAGSSKQYPLTIERVKEIAALNAEGQKPDDLGAVEMHTIVSEKNKTIDAGFVNDVGQITLSALSKADKKKKKQKAKGGQQQQPQGVKVPAAPPKKSGNNNAVGSRQGGKVRQKAGERAAQPVKRDKNTTDRAPKDNSNGNMPSRPQNKNKKS